MGSFDRRAREAAARGWVWGCLCSYPMACSRSDGSRYVILRTYRSYVSVDVRLARLRMQEASK